MNFLIINFAMVNDDMYGSIYKVCMLNEEMNAFSSQYYKITAARQDSIISSYTSN